MEEKTLYAETPKMVKAAPIRFIIYLFLIFLYGLGLALLAIWFLKCRNTKLVIKENEINFSYGVLSKNRTDIPRAKVASCHVYQGFFDRLLSVCKVKVYTSGDVPEFTVWGMPHPQKLRDVLR